MIVSNSRKLIYLRVPRTGSTSLSNFLIEHLVFSPECDFHTPVPYNGIAGLNFSAARNVHANLDDILSYGILKFPLSEYAIYGIIREPVDRFLSSAWHACRHQGIEVTDNNQAVNYAWPLADPNAPIFRPQTDWLLHKGTPINRIFTYEQLDGLAQEILGSDQVRVTFRHRSDSRKQRSPDLDPGLREKILALYKGDQDLYERTIGGISRQKGTPSS